MHSFEQILWCLVAPQLAMNRPTNHPPFPQSLVARPSRRDKSRVRSGPRVESLWVVRAARRQAYRARRGQGQLQGVPDVTRDVRSLPGRLAGVVPSNHHRSSHMKSAPGAP